MNPLNSKGSPRSQSGANSSPPEKPAEGTTPNTASNPTTAGSDTRFISAFLKSRNMTRLMQGYPVRSMEEFYQAGKALLDIPADENVEFIVKGDVASRLSLDEFARIAPTLAAIQVVSRPPKTNNPHAQSQVNSPAPEEKTSPPAQSEVNSPAPEKRVEGTTPASNAATAGSDTRFISAFLKSRNMTRLMQGYPVRSMEEFYQAGKALLDIPANENVEFIVNGDVASRLSLDEFARIAPTLAVIQVVSRPPKKV